MRLIINSYRIGIAKPLNDVIGNRGPGWYGNLTAVNFTGGNFLKLKLPVASQADDHMVSGRCKGALHVLVLLISRSYDVCIGRAVLPSARPSFPKPCEQARFPFLHP